MDRLLGRMQSCYCIYLFVSHSLRLATPIGNYPTRNKSIKIYLITNSTGTKCREANQGRGGYLYCLSSGAHQRKGSSPIENAHQLRVEFNTN